MVVDLQIGLMTNGVMMKITMQAATLMVELAVTITLADGLPIVKYIWFNYLKQAFLCVLKRNGKYSFYNFFAGLWMFGLNLSFDFTCHL